MWRKVQEAWKKMRKTMRREMQRRMGAFAEV
jgi:hypothetical protein